MLLSRRHFLHTAALSTAAASLPHRLLCAQAAAVAPPDRLTAMRTAGASAKITATPLRRNVTALTGSGGNIAVLTGPGSDGKLVIDSSFSTSRPQVSSALDALGPAPLTHLINTHWHADHTDGNDWMHTAGATIVAHENTRRRLSSTQFVAAFSMTVPPLPPGGVPTVVFDQEHTLHLNGETLHLAHYQPAHTDTDISVHFAEADILHTGDTFFNGLYPFIDYSTGGSIDGMIRAAAANLSLATTSTILIPGHGPIGNRAQLQSSHEMLTAVRARVANLKQEGRSADDVVAAKPTAPFDATFKPAVGPVDNFVRFVYQGV